ncbi:MAG: YicC family protein [Wenzhouxiangellaceae bacterium]|nr:YicC family protein [Wenzhouxiangellaceae bacterium]MBS3746014.1 YicC family protein [Wenzhouxiangellaceae bacterium]MBS3822376.1 YicC family protein [Wenzhouxiangellaceae bacterium]
MIHSMTAYASRSDAATAGQLFWELKSVNQRYLDLSPRLPEEFRVLEPEIRARFKQRFSRGKIEINLRYQPDPAAEAATLELNEALARSLLARLERLQKLAGDTAEQELIRLLAWPGMIIEQRPDFDAERARALDLLDCCIDDLAAARAQEGRAIADMLRPRLDGILEQVAKVRKHLPAVREALKTRFEERLAGLGQDIEPGRMEQEIALQLTRLDVDEELDRLEAHVAEIRRVLELEEPVGRRLDFLMQELNREANTLGSKSVAAETTGVAVELKVLIEQMREQIQNVE